MSLESFLPSFVQDFLVNLIGVDCFESFFLKYEFTNIPCLKLSISKVLGLGIVAGAMFVKVPQIQVILAKKSAQGLSVFGNLLELVCFTISLAYNISRGFPFSTYGETFFLVMQDFIIFLLMILYSFPTFFVPVFIILYSFYAYSLFGGLISYELLGLLQQATVTGIIVSRLPQIYTNYKNGNTGNLSALTVFMFAAGSSARIFTTLQEVDDFNILIGFLLSTSLNIILAIQIIYYWNSTKVAQKKVADKKKK